MPPRFLHSPSPRVPSPREKWYAAQRTKGETMRASLRPDRSSVIAALAARRLDKTLTTSLPVHDPRDPFAVGSTGLARLDAGLDGGWPRGHLSELVGPASSGRSSVYL